MENVAPEKRPQFQTNLSRQHYLLSSLKICSPYQENLKIYFSPSVLRSLALCLRTNILTSDLRFPVSPLPPSPHNYKEQPGLHSRWGEVVDYLPPPPFLFLGMVIVDTTRVYKYQYLRDYCPEKKLEQAGAELVQAHSWT